MMNNSINYTQVLPNAYKWLAPWTLFKKMIFGSSYVAFYTDLGEGIFDLKQIEHMTAKEMVKYGTNVLKDSPKGIIIAYPYRAPWRRLSKYDNQLIVLCLPQHHNPDVVGKLVEDSIENLETIGKALLDGSYTIPEHPPKKLSEER